MSQEPQCTIEISFRKWTDDERRAAKPCQLCNALTQGRLESKPYCMNCAMVEMLKPLRVVRSLAKEAAL